MPFYDNFCVFQNYGREMNPTPHNSNNSLQLNQLMQPTQAMLPTQYMNAMQTNPNSASMSGLTPSPALPTGLPSGPANPGAPSTGIASMSPLAPMTPTTVQSPYYFAGQLKNYVGREVRVEFLIGSSGPLVDRTGTLLEVGASYIIIKPINTDDLLMCDLYSIKFVNIYQ